VPTDSFEYSDKLWIDEWLRSNFSRIAEAVAPRGVIIAPHERKSQHYIESIFGRDGRGAVFGVAGKVDPSVQILETGFPFLIVSRIPLQALQDAADVVMINLGICKDQNQLGAVFDTVVRAVREDRWDLLHEITFQESVEYESNWLFALNNALELKPNVFGVGLNLNNVFKMIGWSILRRRGKLPR
jgi:hypothetical protein